eukprot:1160679-Pelagomonas_calceolata.AAC.23
MQRSRCDAQGVQGAALVRDAQGVQGAALGAALVCDAQGVQGAALVCDAHVMPMSWYVNSNLGCAAGAGTCQGHCPNLVKERK